MGIHVQWSTRAPKLVFVVPGSLGNCETCWGLPGEVFNGSLKGSRKSLYGRLISTCLIYSGNPSLLRERAPN